MYFGTEFKKENNQWKKFENDTADVFEKFDYAVNRDILINCIKHRPGFEPGSPPWQGSVLPLDYRCLIQFINMPLLYILCISSFQGFLQILLLSLLQI